MTLETQEEYRQSHLRLVSVCRMIDLALERSGELSNDELLRLLAPFRTMREAVLEDIHEYESKFKPPFLKGLP